MTTYQLLLFFHILSVFFFVGAAGSSTITGVIATRTTHPRTMVTVLDIQHSTEWYVALPAGVSVVTFGVLLISELGYSHADNWISWAYTFITLMGILDFWVRLPRNRRIRARAQELAAAGVQEAPELREAARALGFAGAGLSMDLLLATILYLMVVKPAL